MTSVSTLVSLFATPLIMLLLAGEMMVSLLKTVLIPVGFGLILRFFRTALCRCCTAGIAVAFDCSDWDRDDDRCSWGAC